MTKSKKLNILKLIGGISLVAIPAVVVPAVMLTSCAAESAISVKTKFAAIDCSSTTLTSTITLTAKDAIDDKTQGKFTVESAMVGDKVVKDNGVTFSVGAWVDNAVAITATVNPDLLKATIAETAESSKVAKVVITYTSKDATPVKTNITVDLTLNKIPAKA